MISICKAQAYIADTLLLAESCKGGTDMTFKLPNQAILYALYAAYVILLRNRMEMGESSHQSQLTRTPYFTATTFWSVMVVTRGRSI